MLTEYQKGSIFGAVMVALAFAFSFFTSPQPKISQTAPGNQTAGDVSGGHQADKSLWDRVVSDPMNVLTLGLLFVGGAQAILFLWQLNLIREGLADTKEAADGAKKSADIANESLLLSKETVERQLRAYVSLKQFGKSPMLDTKTNALLGWSLFRASTQRPRRTMLEKLAVAHGSTDIEDITRSVIQDSMNARRETIHMANAWLTTVSNMFDWATKEHMEDPATGRSAPILENNPCELVKRFQEPKKDGLDEEEDGHPTWSDADLDAFEAAYSHGTRQRLIYEVLLCTGLRVGDAARVGRQHVKDDVLRLKTEKTHTWVALRVLPRLKHALAVGPKGLDTELAWITLKRTGKAMDKNYLGRLFGEACRNIGLDRSAHGLRKAAARRYIEAGARPEQLKAIFGWETSAMVDKYTKKFNREKVSIRAMDDFVLDVAFAPTLVLGGERLSKRE